MPALKEIQHHDYDTMRVIQHSDPAFNIVVNKWFQRIMEVPTKEETKRLMNDALHIINQTNPVQTRNRTASDADAVRMPKPKEERSPLALKPFDKLRGELKGLKMIKPIRTTSDQTTPSSSPPRTGSKGDEAETDGSAGDDETEHDEGGHDVATDDEKYCGAVPVPVRSHDVRPPSTYGRCDVDRFEVEESEDEEVYDGDDFDEILQNFAEGSSHTAESVIAYAKEKGIGMWSFLAQIMQYYNRTAGPFFNDEAHYVTVC